MLVAVFGVARVLVTVSEMSSVVVVVVGMSVVLVTVFGVARVLVAVTRVTTVLVIVMSVPRVFVHVVDMALVVMLMDHGRRRFLVAVVCDSAQNCILSENYNFMVKRK